MAERDSVGRPLSMDFTQAAALYLQGWALELAGPVNEGRQLQERAKLLAFDIPDSHLQLARTLALLGRTKEADRHCALIPLLTIVSAGTNAHWLRTELALKANDDFLAADCWERYLLCLLTSGSGGFGDPEAYLAAAQQVHLYRARGHLARGHVEAALSEVQLAMRLLPGDVELPIDLVPQLDKLGRKPEADNLFHRVFSLHEAVCSDYPRAAGHHNQAAWLPARCRRQLDKGLEHARRAVELAPDNPTYLDTLAEVHFQRGDTDRAVELAKRCVELEPADNYYDRQLDRFRAGDPMADVPQRVPNDR
jgi:tetratricopeptide (TPR) repeat protein